MPPPTAGRADGRRNRDAVLDAAERLVSRSGTVTMAEVAAAAGVTRPTLYRHFPDRQALVDALLLRVAQQEVTEVLGCLEADTPGEAVSHLAVAVVGAGRRHQGLLRVSGRRLDELARTLVGDEPLQRRIAEWRAAGHVTTSSGDAWLAMAARALCLLAVADERPADQVAADLGEALGRLLA